MNEFPISDEAVEAAARAHAFSGAVHNTWPPQRGRDHGEALIKAKVAVQAFLTAEGFEVERHAANRAGTPAQQRLVSPWRPVGDQGERS